MAAANVIEEGMTVVFDVNGDKQSIITVRGKSKVKLGKAYCSTDALIGCPFGSLFTLAADGKSLQRTEHVPSTEWDAPVEVTRDNSKLVDANNTNQQLTQGDLAAMREAGTGGEAIIEALTSNSATFHTKTEFAQEKYKKRKAKKYVLLATARRPTAATVAAAYFSKQPSRVGYLRGDALALMLSMANVGAGARVLVMEACGGLVAGAVAERLGGHGVVCSTYPGARAPPALDAARTFNLDAGSAATARTVPLLQLLEQRQAQKERAEAPSAALPADGQVVQPVEESGAASIEQVADAGVDAGEGANATATGGGGAVDVDAEVAAVPTADAAPPPGDLATAEAGTAAGAPAAPVSAAQTTAAPAAVTHGPLYSSLILASSEVEPTAAMGCLLPLLAPSASFAVHSLSLQPLAECMAALRAGGLAVRLAVQEAWYREHQVLPSRTHPTMAMNHGGGYLLSGTATLQGTQLPTGLERE